MSFRKRRYLNNHSPSGYFRPSHSAARFGKARLEKEDWDKDVSAYIVFYDADSIKFITVHKYGGITMTGDILVKHYSDPEKVRRLIELGDVIRLREKLEPSRKSHSFADPEPDVTVFYTRDCRPMEPKPAAVISDIAELKLFARYQTYIFKDGKWFLRGYDRNYELEKEVERMNK